ncbi:3-keto-disaccharide hydrolase [Paraglaciecola sp.]|uniref:3-keto-disaccharide hydrolase n=1 Tax=Paraglaciecola sp. TaxID=1920173 RepID=UPI003EF94F52
MKSVLSILVAAILLLSCAQNGKPKPYALLDKDLSQFSNIYKFGTAKMVGDELVLNSTGNWFFTTKKRYKNFILTGEIIMPDVKEYSNSGFMFRGSAIESKKGIVAAGYQAEVDPSDRKWSGGLYHQGGRQWLHPVHAKRSNLDQDFKKNFFDSWTPEMANAYKHLQWNKYRIECINNEIKIYLNGVLTTHVLDNKLKEGFIGLQHHGSAKLRKTGKTDNVVRFRNVMITELD